MKRVRGQFGSATVQDWESTHGTNQKGGMNDEEFQKYAETNILRLYPDAADVKGR